MIEIEEALQEATMSPDEIVMRFKKLFGREMTAKEREIFFLGPEPAKTKPESAILAAVFCPQTENLGLIWVPLSLPSREMGTADFARGGAGTSSARF
jgi:hypothetical protein